MIAQLNKVCIYIAVLILGTSVNAQKESKVAFEMDNEVSALYRDFKSIESADFDRYAELRFESKLALELGSQVKIQSDVLYYWNKVNEDRRRFFVNELFISSRIGNVFMEVGKSTRKWGSLVGFSSLDIPNKSEYFDFLDSRDEYLGLWGAQLKSNIGAVNFQLNVTENNNNSKFYYTDNRWIRLPKQIVSDNKMLPFQFEGIAETRANERLQFFASLDFDINNLNTALSYYNGMNDTPLRRIVPSVPGAGGLTYELQLLYQNLTIYSLANKLLLGDWNLTSEVSYMRNWRVTTEVVPDNYTTLNFGLDRTFLLSDDGSHLFGMLQYLWSIGSGDKNYNYTEIDHIFSNALLSEWRLQLVSGWNVEMLAMYQFQNNGLLLSPRLGYKITDWLHLAIAYDAMSGDQKGFLGHYSDNNRFSLTSKMYF